MWLVVVIGWDMKMTSHPNSNASFINIWDRLIWLQSPNLTRSSKLAAAVHPTAEGFPCTQAVLRKKWNPGSPNGPPMIDGWVVRPLSSGWFVNNILRTWNQLKNWSKWANRFSRFIQTKYKQTYRWFRARLQYFQCISNGDTAVLC